MQARVRQRAVKVKENNLTQCSVPDCASSPKKGVICATITEFSQVLGS